MVVYNYWLYYNYIVMLYTITKYVSEYGSDSAVALHSLCRMPRKQNGRPYNAM